MTARQLTKSGRPKSERTLKMEARREEERIASIQWAAERAEERRQYAFILNHVGTRKKCLLCARPIDEEPKLKPKRPSYFNDEYWINAVRLMPQLCYQCFIENTSREKVVKEISRRLRRPLLRKAKLRPLSLQRKSDLLVLLSQTARIRYGCYDVRDLANKTRDKTSAAVLWQASAVYRHLRKRFRIKGAVCRDYEGDWNYAGTLFTGRRVAEIQQRYIRFLDNEYDWSPYDIPFGYVWEAHVGHILHNRSERYSRHLLSMDVPLRIRLRYYKKHKRRDEESRRIARESMEEYEKTKGWAASSRWYTSHETTASSDAQALDAASNTDSPKAPQRRTRRSSRKASPTPDTAPAPEA
jgi:hypothetical protein